MKKLISLAAALLCVFSVSTVNPQMLYAEDSVVVLTEEHTLSFAKLMEMTDDEILKTDEIYTSVDEIFGETTSVKSSALYKSCLKTAQNRDNYLYANQHEFEIELFLSRSLSEDLIKELYVDGTFIDPAGNEFQAVMESKEKIAELLNIPVEIVSSAYFSGDYLNPTEDSYYYLNGIPFCRLELTVDLNAYGEENEEKLMAAILFSTHGTVNPAVGIQRLNGFVLEPEGSSNTKFVKIGMADASGNIYGDADENGNVDITDAVKIMSFVTNFESYALSEIGQQLADVYNTGDGISNMDALEIQKYLANIIN